MTWYVYMVLCADNTLYTGISTDTDRRINEHNAGKGAKYTAARRPVSLVYTERLTNRSEASKREWEIKQMSRSKKQHLIAEQKTKHQITINQ